MGHTPQKVPVCGGRGMTKIALILNEDELEYLSLLVIADQISMEELSVEDPELELKYRFHLMEKHNLSKQIDKKIDAIFQQIDNNGGLHIQ